DLAITNMSRPSRGLIGIRLDPSEEFGPTGEERYGTNLLGSIATSLDELMKNIQEGDIVYVREAAQKPAPVRKPKKTQVARRTATKKVAAKTPVKKSREAKRAKEQ
ncbi:MAG TPA: hypothetical protein VEH08_03580, partial [Methanomassiliicoccales archaeon]|nr:hypothetical protein [Methanomassiliicoccales archaeon]